MAQERLRATHGPARRAEPAPAASGRPGGRRAGSAGGPGRARPEGRLLLEERGAGPQGGGPGGAAGRARLRRGPPGTGQVLAAAGPPGRDGVPRGRPGPLVRAGGGGVRPGLGRRGRLRGSAGLRHEQHAAGERPLRPPHGAGALRGGPQRGRAGPRPGAAAPRRRDRDRREGRDPLGRPAGARGPRTGGLLWRPGAAARRPLRRPGHGGGEARLREPPLRGAQGRDAHRHLLPAAHAQRLAHRSDPRHQGRRHRAGRSVQRAREPGRDLPGAAEVLVHVFPRGCQGQGRAVPRALAEGGHGQERQGDGGREEGGRGRLAQDALGLPPHGRLHPGLPGRRVPRRPLRPGRRRRRLLALPLAVRLPGAVPHLLPQRLVRPRGSRPARDARLENDGGHSCSARGDEDPQRRAGAGPALPHVVLRPDADGAPAEPLRGGPDGPGRPARRAVRGCAHGDRQDAGHVSRRRPDGAIRHVDAGLPRARMLGHRGLPALDRARVHALVAHDQGPTVHHLRGVPLRHDDDPRLPAGGQVCGELHGPPGPVVGVELHEVLRQRLGRAATHALFVLHGGQRCRRSRAHPRVGAAGPGRHGADVRLPLGRDPALPDRHGRSGGVAAGGRGAGAAGPPGAAGGGSRPGERRGPRGLEARRERGLRRRLPEVPGAYGPGPVRCDVHGRGRRARWHRRPQRIGEEHGAARADAPRRTLPGNHQGGRHRRREHGPEDAALHGDGHSAGPSHVLRRAPEEPGPDRRVRRGERRGGLRQGRPQGDA
mmetsp:Transcript_31441/g.68534  ORF Transcript_31441/g.68534 Transcript_31441/m.68534 type:complete len:769 (+) Transcript_31441:1276-3582(+)